MPIAPPLSSEVEPTFGLLGRLFASTALEQVGFRLWEGTRWPDETERAATIVLKHPDTMRAMFATGTEKGLAEAYVRGDFEVEGDLEAACELADALSESASNQWFPAAARAVLQLRVAPRRPGLGRTWSSVGAWRRQRHSLKRDQQAVSFHYDVSNDFYELWLDPRMLYSCAYFERADDDLAAAQVAKLEYLCRKLRLRPGQRLLDIGCGWGGLAIFAAQHFGVTVTGITLSEQQVALASSRVKEAGLDARVRIELRDYRELTEREGYDAVVSVGMAEHVGRENLPVYFRQAFEQLRPGGVFLNHAISEGVRARPTQGTTFMLEYVFPDSDIPPIPPVLSAAESVGFEVRDVENLREHYVLTLRHWRRRLEEAQPPACELVDDATYRVWRLYLAGSAHRFRRTELAIYQTLLVKPNQRGEAPLPLTRRDWYSPR